MMVSMETRTITDVDFFSQLGADIGNWYNEAVEVCNLQCKFLARTPQSDWLGIPTHCSVCLCCVRLVAFTIEI